jgi:hypothetical protein
VKCWTTEGRISDYFADETPVDTVAADACVWLCVVEHVIVVEKVFIWKIAKGREVELES